MNECCLACGSGLEGSRIDYPGSGKETGLSFDEIEICPQCGFGVAIPRVTQGELDQFYASGAYWDGVVSENPYQMAHEASQSKIRVEACLPALTSLDQVRVLEIGAGHAYTIGWLEHYLGKRFCCYDFIEHDEERARQIETENHVAHRYSKLQACAKAYDLILMNHVLEHVVDPFLFLSDVIGHLDVGGIVHVETPHSDYRYKEDVFPHTLFFTEPAYAALEKRLGLERVRCESFGRSIRESVSDKLSAKVIGQLFKFTVLTGGASLCRWADRLLWQYGRRSDNRIWLRWIVRRCED